MLDVVQRVADAAVAHALMLIDFKEHDRRERRLPVVRVNDVGSFSRLAHEFERRLGEEGEADVLVGKAVVGAAVEVVVARMRLDEEALATVYKPEMHRAVDLAVGPRHPKVLVGDLQSPDLVVAHAIVFRQDDLHRLAA